ncbi:DUF2497 domain-containing protein [Fodinicurvata halophila]|uniref:DUF2497 domain-containing protein n=1 Tax=Fodinicurvata halophila TaxID=1419723 RepID=A0ABV8UK63_9PROT
MSNPDGQSEPSMEEILASIRRIISEDDKEQKDTARQNGGKTPGSAESEFASAESGEEDILDLTDKAEQAGSADSGGQEDSEEAATLPPDSDPFEQSAADESFAEPGETAPDPFEALQETGFAEELAKMEEDMPAQADEPSAGERMQDEDEAAMESAQQAEDAMTEEARQDAQSETDDGSKDEGLVSSATAAATVAVLSEATRDVRGQARAAEDLPIQNDKTLEGLVREAMKPLLKEWLDQNLAPLVERVVREEVRRMVRRAEDD